jgi:hypothetical protein
MSELDVRPPCEHEREKRTDCDSNPLGQLHGAPPPHLKSTGLSARHTKSLDHPFRGCRVTLSGDADRPTSGRPPYDVWSS